MSDSKSQAQPQLLLWRHAEAEDGFPDSARALTRKGQGQASRVAQWLRPRLTEGSRILVSPARRAQQTAAALDLPFETEVRIDVQTSVANILDAAAWPQRKGMVLVVGHQPTLGRLAAWLLTGTQEEWSVKKGGLWWFAHRGGEIVLRAVISPDLL